MQFFDIIHAVAVAASLALLVIGIVVSVRAKAAAAPRRAIVAEYERPSEIDLLEAGVLAGRRHTTIQAALVDLAVRGTLRIVRMPDNSFELHLLSLDGITATENRVVNLVFGLEASPGATRQIARDAVARANRWKAAQLRVEAAAQRALVERGYVLTSQSRPAVTLALASLFAFLATLISGFAVLDDRGPVGWVVVAGLVALAVPIVLFSLAASHPLALSRDGGDLRDRLSGIELFVRVAEADRLRVLQGPATALADPVGVVRIYEKLLPFAVLWGLEQEWARTLRMHLDAEPDWWFGPLDDFGPALVAFSIALSADTDAGGGHDGHEPGDPADSFDGGGSDGGGGDGGGGGGGGD